MVRPLWLLSSCIAALSQAACHVPGCREGDLACIALQETGDTSGSTSGDPVTGTPDPTGPDTDTSSSEGTAEPTTGESSGGPAVCGDGVAEGAEECDDGNAADDDACVSDCRFARCGDGHTQVGLEECDDGNRDSTDDCTEKCQVPRCGDGLLHPDTEVCDAGNANADNIYDGCNTLCEPGPRCGDSKVNGPEDCDDNNDDLSDGCLPGCIEATSCKQILEMNAGAPSGKYRIWPEALGGNLDLAVHCDMQSDGGGYTFLKVDTEVANVSDKGAKAAELICQGYGMHLFVTRTQAHLKSAYTFATTDNIAPVGGGTIGKGAEYLSILAIYPKVPAATCKGKGLNSVDCPMWRAHDDQQFWVTNIEVVDEPSEEHCAGCSMLYKWNVNGTLKSYTTFPSGEGASTYRFLCDVADKF